MDRRLMDRQAAGRDRRVLLSRYGGPVDKRLDEDIDALRQRVAALEARLDAQT